MTSCPACQQGLARYADETGLKTDYIVVELARHLLDQHGLQAVVVRGLGHRQHLHEGSPVQGVGEPEVVALRRPVR